MYTKRRIWGVIAALLPFCAFALPVHADIGPKPAVHVTVQGLEGRDYAVTLLAPPDAWRGPWGSESWREYTEDDGPRESWQALADYEDPDGWGFWGCWADCGATGQFDWNYYAPQRFKLLIWLADADAYLVSEPLDHYTYDSYYTAVCTPDGGMQVRRSYAYGRELGGLAGRAALTIGAELALALLLGWRGRRELLVLCGVNLVTQLGLNLGLYLTEYTSGPLLAVLTFPLWELGVFVLEAAAFVWLLPGVTATGRKRHPIWFALGANLMTMLLGGWMADWLPWLF